MGNHLFKLFPAQAKIMRSDADRTLMVCGRGVGKSFIGAHWAARQMVESAAKGLVLAPVLAQAHEFLSYLTPLLSTLGFAWVYNRRPPDGWGAGLTDYHAILTARLPGDARLRYVYIGTGENFEAVRSKSVGWVVLDEAALLKHEAYVKAVLPALRGQGADYRYRVLLLTTPRGAGNWVSELVDQPGVDVIRAPSWENHIEYPLARIQEFKRTMGRLEFDQEIKGEIVNAGDGLMIYEFKCRDLADPTLTPGKDEVWVSSDQNVAPMVSIIALVSRDKMGNPDRIEVAGEAVVPDSAAVAEFADLLQRRLTALGVTKSALLILTGDASGNARNVVSRKTFYQHLLERLRESGWRVADRTFLKNPSVFKTAEAVNAGLAGGSLTIAKGCNQLIKDCSKARYKRGEMVTDKVHHDPHALDCLRMLVHRVHSQPVGRGNMGLGR